MSNKNIISFDDFFNMDLTEEDPTKKKKKRKISLDEFYMEGSEEEFYPWGGKKDKQPQRFAPYKPIIKKETQTEESEETIFEKVNCMPKSMPFAFT